MNADLLLNMVSDILGGYQRPRKPKAPKAKRGGKTDFYHSPWDDYSTDNLKTYIKYITDNFQHKLDEINVTKARAVQARLIVLLSKHLTTDNKKPMSDSDKQSRISDAVKTLREEYKKIRIADPKKKKEPHEEKESKEEKESEEPKEPPLVIHPDLPALPVPGRRKKFKLTRVLFTTIIGNPKLEWKQTLKNFFTEMGITDYNQLPPTFLEAFNTVDFDQGDHHAAKEIEENIVPRFRQEFGALKNPAKTASELQQANIKLKKKPQKKKATTTKVRAKPVLNIPETVSITPKAKTTRKKHRPLASEHSETKKPKVIKTKPHALLATGKGKNKGVEIEM